MDLLTKEQINEISLIESRMKKTLKESRFRHTVSVAHMAAALAMKYNAPLYKAMAAGMLHDCAKRYSEEELLLRCRKKGLEIRKAEEENPALLHSKYSAFLAETKYGTDDPEILSAITWHTTGKPDMSLLDKIIFTADYIEPYRNHSDRLPMIREQAFTDLDGAVLTILEDTLKYLKKRNIPFDEMTLLTYDYYSAKSVLI
ncbi:MAG: bis(5'-nucleosyl)-tetraphosphatase (symmetrical) YqeK [Lachnospiraceae bacterium]|nr:bis(5'-nucleosyl)-tetraphosphatase (symmetrical) YqeK [Lachnospiraceae bacterium]